MIPRLVDNSGGSCDYTELCPEEWNVFDVAQFLRVNDCANYCDAFNKQVCIYTVSTKICNNVSNFFITGCRRKLQINFSKTAH